MRLSHAEFRKIEMQLAKEAICKILNWSHDQYAEYQYEKGLAFIAIYYKSTYSTDVIRHVEGSKTFWQWWRNSWLNREDVYLHNVGGCNMGQPLLKQLYIELHRPSTLADEIYPPQEIWKEILPLAIKKEVAHDRI